MEGAVVEVDKVDVLYDRERDVLYISFGRPQEADESELLENDILVRYRGKRVIGVTVLSFSNRCEK